MTEDTVARSVSAIIQETLSPTNARSVLAHATAGSRSTQASPSLTWKQIDDAFLGRIDGGLKLFGVTRLRRLTILEKVREAARSEAACVPVPSQVRIPIHGEASIVVARNSIRDFAHSLGFALTDRVKIATIVSELARNIHIYCGAGEVIAKRAAGTRQGIEIVARDRGAGIADLDHVLSGGYQSRTGMGLGLIGCKRLSDEFRVETGPRGTNVQVNKYLR